MRKMKIGIDNYCYHRFMGEVYPEQNKPDKIMTLDNLRFKLVSADQKLGETQEQVVS